MFVTLANGFPIPLKSKGIHDYEPNGIPFGSKSLGKQSLLRTYISVNLNVIGIHCSTCSYIQRNLI